MHATLAIAMCGLAVSCVSGSYSHVCIDEPVRDSWLSSLRPGQDDLARCLALLGAPHHVFEYRVAPNLEAGVAMLWVWHDASGWGVELSGESINVYSSISFDQLSRDMPGCVLWFGPNLVLEMWQRGKIGEMLRDHGRTPAPVDLDLARAAGVDAPRVARMHKEMSR